MVLKLRNVTGNENKNASNIFKKIQGQALTHISFIMTLGIH